MQSVRERIEDKRKAVLGAMSPMMAQDRNSQRSTQLAFAPGPRSHAAIYTDLLSGSSYPGGGFQHMSVPHGLYAQGLEHEASPMHSRAPPVQPSLTDKLRTSFVAQHARAMQPHSQESSPVCSPRADSSSPQGMTAPEHPTPSHSAVNAQLLSALRVCTDSGFLSCILQGSSTQPSSRFGDRSSGAVPSVGQPQRDLPQGPMQTGVAASFGAEQPHMMIMQPMGYGQRPELANPQSSPRPGSGVKRRRSGGEGQPVPVVRMTHHPPAVQYHRIPAVAPARALPVLLDPGELFHLSLNAVFHLLPV